MFPLPGLAQVDYVVPFWGARALPISDREDYEDGPIALQDASQGLHVQPWRGRLVNGAVYLASATYPEQKVLEQRYIDSFSFTFDQNARYLITFTRGEQLYLHWYDPVVSTYVTELLAEGVITPRITLDDKRRNQQTTSNVLLFYVQGDNIYVRKQSDRYGIAYLVLAGTGHRLLRVGMNLHYRLQLLFQANDLVCTTCTLPWRNP